MSKTRKAQTAFAAFVRLRRQWDKMNVYLAVGSKATKGGDVPTAIKARRAFDAQLLEMDAQLDILETALERLC